MPSTPIKKFKNIILTQHLLLHQQIIQLIVMIKIQTNAEVVIPSMGINLKTFLADSILSLVLKTYSWQTGVTIQATPTHNVYTQQVPHRYTCCSLDFGFDAHHWVDMNLTHFTRFAAHRRHSVPQHPHDTNGFTRRIQGLSINFYVISSHFPLFTTTAAKDADKGRGFPGFEWMYVVRTFLFLFLFLRFLYFLTTATPPFLLQYHALTTKGDSYE